jgi:hypothetical protein
LVGPTARDPPPGAGAAAGKNWLSWRDPAHVGWGLHRGGKRVPDRRSSGEFVASTAHASWSANARPREARPPVPQWPGAPAAYSQLSEAYADQAAQARELGWPATQRVSHHLAPVTDPGPGRRTAGRTARPASLQAAAPPRSEGHEHGGLRHRLDRKPPRADIGPR